MRVDFRTFALTLTAVVFATTACKQRTLSELNGEPSGAFIHSASEWPSYFETSMAKYNDGAAGELIKHGAFSRLGDESAKRSAAKFLLKMLRQDQIDTAPADLARIRRDGCHEEAALSIYDAGYIKTRLDPQGKLQQAYEGLSQDAQKAIDDAQDAAGGLYAVGCLKTNDLDKVLSKVLDPAFRDEMSTMTISSKGGLVSRSGPVSTYQFTERTEAKGLLSFHVIDEAYFNLNSHTFTLDGVTWIMGSLYSNSKATTPVYFREELAALMPLSDGTIAMISTGKTLLHYNYAPKSIVKALARREEPKVIAAQNKIFRALESDR